MRAIRSPSEKWVESLFVCLTIGRGDFFECFDDGSPKFVPNFFCLPRNFLKKSDKNFGYIFSTFLSGGVVKRFRGSRKKQNSPPGHRHEIRNSRMRCGWMDGASINKDNGFFLGFYFLFPKRRLSNFQRD